MKEETDKEEKKEEWNEKRWSEMSSILPEVSKEVNEIVKKRCDNFDPADVFCLIGALSIRTLKDNIKSIQENDLIQLMLDMANTMVVKRSE